MRSKYSNPKSVKTVNEVLAEYDRVENIPNVYWTEAKFIGFDLIEAGEIGEELVREVFLYDEKEYRKAFNEDVDFNDLYNDPNARVLCLGLWKTPKFPDESVIGYRYNNELGYWEEIRKL